MNPELRILQNRFKELVMGSGLPPHLFSEVLGMKPRELADLVWLNRPLFKYAHAQRVQRRLGIDLSNTTPDRIERRLLRQRVMGEKRALPLRYRQLAHSHVRSSANIIEYLRLTRGWEYTRQLLARFQIHESLFEHHDDRINFIFFMDLFEALTGECGVKPNELKLMAFHSAVLNSTTAFGAEIASAKTDEERYTIFARKTDGYDTNFNYIVEIHDDHAMFITRPNEALQVGLKIPVMGSRAICHYKQQVFASIPLYSGLAPLDVTEFSCLYLGDKECRYSARFRTFGPKIKLLSRLE